MGCLCSKGAYATTYEDVAGSKKIALESPGRLGCRFAGIKFGHNGVENSKRHRGSGKLVLVDEALHFWLRCTDVYFAIELKDCVKVELRDSWGGVRIQRTGKEKERTAIVVVTFKSRGWEDAEPGWVRRAPGSEAGVADEDAAGGARRRRVQHRRGPGPTSGLASCTTSVTLTSSN